MRIAAYITGMTEAIALLAALSEPTRLAAVRLLTDGGEHCVCELMYQLGATQSRMSRHMATLKAVGLVSDRRDAQWVRYRIRNDMPPETRAVIDAVLAMPAREMPVRADSFRSVA